MPRIAFTLLLLAVLESPSHAQWSEVSPSGITPAHVYAAWFLNPDTGWAVGASGGIIKKVSSGAPSNWISQSGLGCCEDLHGVHFVDASTGWVVGTGRTIAKTTNGGTTWVKQGDGGFVTLSAVYFVNASTGWAVGGGGSEKPSILKTTNGGTLWNIDTTTFTHASHFLRGIHFADASTGWLAMREPGDSGSVRKTTDGGATWTLQAKVAGEMRSVHFVNAATGWAVGANGIILATTNGGATWSPQVSGRTNLLTAVRFVSAARGWAVGYGGTILATTNGGATWTSQSLQTPRNLHGLHVAAGNGWAVGDNQTVLTMTGTTSIHDAGGPGGRTGFQVAGAGTSTRIRFELPSPEGRVSLKVYDLGGAEAATLVNGPLGAGPHEVGFDASALPRGTYLYVLRAGAVRETVREVKLK